MSALILGFFASCWFSWAQEQPPDTWRSPLDAGAALSLAVAAVGALAAWRSWSDGSALAEPGAMRRYGIVVGLEFAVAAAGAAVIAAWGRAEYLAPWVCLVVGVHFWPLASVMQSRALLVLGLAMMAIAVVAALFGGQTALAPSTLAGTGAGSAMLAFAAWSVATTIARRTARYLR